MCVLLDMYEERGMEKINSLYHCLLEDNRMEDIQKAMLDAAYQKELLREYGIGESQCIIFIGKNKGKKEIPSSQSYSFSL